MRPANEMIQAGGGIQGVSFPGCRRPAVSGEIMRYLAPILTLCLAAGPATKPTTQPTTQPTTKPTAKYESSIPRIMADLRAEVATLRSQLQLVKAENASL